MPRFSAGEREIIRQRLMREGERLFAAFGVKKVTVDEIVRATGIAKGTFYTFYPSKEHLYIEINFQLQQKLFENIETVVKKKHYPTQKALTKDVIMMSLTGIITSPILSQIDLSIMDYLQRKLSPDIFSNHMYNDIRILEMLQQMGVQFTVPHTVLIKSLYSVLTCLEQFREDEELEQIQTLLVDGIVEQVVKK